MSGLSHRVTLSREGTDGFSPQAIVVLDNENSLRRRIHG